MNKKTKVKMVVAPAICTLFLMGCSKACYASYNVSKEADNFNVYRKITVTNVRTDSILYELTGFFSIETNNAHNELEIVCCVGDGKYYKDFIYLNDWTTYIVEDLNGSDVSPYHYEIKIMPKSIPIAVPEVED